MFRWLFRNKSPRYFHHLIVCDSQKDHLLWETSCWLRIRDALMPVVAESKGSTKCDVLLLDESRDGPVKKSCSWKNTSWTLEREIAKTVELAIVNVSVPSLDYCNKHRIWTDLYLSAIRANNGRWSQVVHVVIRESLLTHDQHVDLGRAILRHLSPIAYATRTAQWVEPELKQCSVPQDFLSGAFFGPEMNDLAVPDFDAIPGNWEVRDFASRR